MLSTNLPASAFTQTYTNASPIKLKKNIFPNDKDKYYHSQQTTYKKITKPISIQTFPISKMKSLHSYTNTASSTVNSEYNSFAFHNNNNNKNGIKEGDGTASSSFGKVGILKDNASFNNILCYSSTQSQKTRR
jgi:gamma-glutamylcysteine synthetase